MSRGWGHVVDKTPILKVFECLNTYTAENEWVSEWGRYRCSGGFAETVKSKLTNHKNHSNDVPIILLEVAKKPTAFGYHDKKNCECWSKFHVLSPLRACAPSSACPAPTHLIQAWDIYLRQDACENTGRASDDPKSS
jgi:hypothetical protein